MVFKKPMYLRGSQPARRNRTEILLGVVFVLAIAAVNYLVFVDDSDTDGPTLDQRLASPVEAPEPADIPDMSPNIPEVVPEITTVSGRMQKGENAQKTLERLGANPYSAGDALSALSRFVNMRGLRIGQEWILELLPEGSVRSLKFPLNKVEYFEVHHAEEGGFVAERMEIETDKELVQVACMIRGSLYGSLDKCGVERVLGRIVADKLGGQIDFFTDSRRGDVLRMIMEKESIEGEFLRWGKIHGIMYEGRVAKASAFPLKGEDGISYYDAEGQSIERPFLRAPLRYTHISSRYSKRRLHPILHTYTPHRAIDYAAPTGTPVHSVGDGKVSFRGWKGASGRLVVVRHDDGYQSYYAHLHRIAKGLRVGDRVSRGAFLGKVGSSGRANGPHLHFAVARKGKFIHPRELFSKPGVTVPKDREMEFMADVGRIVGELKALSVRGSDGSRP